ncbi:unnamed protein product [Bursaphelenchus okinawaensis]|uniref:WD_REPEATS_REGION domain-containing protein n=1 Tax=Bursaphelenchus okinawaensis TaxID=465554 RepID=A0A811KM99_9BILA|nr:unnamed protein product [Bursaphelenchus okinawaensis]CAG9106016.1 unnamed protein product [Bursaphelenchus okinawaensis]
MLYILHCISFDGRFHPGYKSAKIRPERAQNAASAGPPGLRRRRRVNDQPEHLPPGERASTSNEPSPDVSLDSATSNGVSSLRRRSNTLRETPHFPRYSHRLRYQYDYRPHPTLDAHIATALSNSFSSTTSSSSTPGSARTSSSKRRLTDSSDSPGQPQVKNRRMQLGSGQNSQSQQSPSYAKSVADRIKGINLNDSNRHRLPDSDLILDGVLDAPDGLLTTLANGNGVDKVEQLKKGKNSTASSLMNNKTKKPSPEPVQLNDFQRNAIRIIGQYLNELGLNSTAEALVEESGCRVENPLAARMRCQMVEGQWTKALETLDRLRPQLTEWAYLQSRVLIIEERVKDLLASNETALALDALQYDYPDEVQFQHRREFYSTLLFRDPVEIMEMFEGRQESVTQALKALHKILPSQILLPPSRFKNLVDQACLFQQEQCDLHVDYDTEITDPSDFVLRDHCCSTSSLPTKCTQYLSEPKSEVWALQFSSCGHYLAAGARFNQVLVYHTKDLTDHNFYLWKRIHIPREVKGVATLSFSGDSKTIAVTATSENTSTGVYVFNLESGNLKADIKPNPQDYSYTSAAFFQNDNRRLVCAGMHGNFECHDLTKERKPISFTGFRIKCLVTLSDGYSVIAADSHNRIRQYNFDDMTEHTLFKEASEIMTFSIDPTESFCLVTSKEMGLRLWCLKTRQHLMTFTGSLHNDYVIQSSFGGKKAEFVATGSQDGKFLIYNRRTHEPIHEIPAHRGHTVNTVVWNPVNANMIASAGDDGTVQIWVPEQIWRRQKRRKSGLNSASSLQSLE